MTIATLLSPGPIAMDVGAITKGRGKGKSKHKSHTAMAARVRKARRANRRRIKEGGTLVRQ